jgi:diketogulonate reductase-like aldo/keto reductase
LAHESEKTMFPVDDDGYFCSDKESHYVETWAVMEELVEEGLTKSIGLSNFNRRQVKNMRSLHRTTFFKIEEILSVTKKHFPCVLQNESHPYLHELDLRNFCAINKIAFQAYSALGSSDRPWRKFGSITSGAPKLGHEILEHPDILKIAEKYGKSTAK